MKTDLLVLWTWEHDADFLGLLQTACIRRGLSVQLLGPKDLVGLSEALLSGQVDARMVIDRAWDLGGEFARHCDVVQQRQMKLLNDYTLVRRAWSKPTMHYEIIAHGLSAPYMIVLPSQEARPVLETIDLSALGMPGACFAVKGAHSGGSGVLPPACSWADVVKRRSEWPGDETILQSWVEPAMLGNRRAWFRVFYACGCTFPCWADDLTHNQLPVTAADESRWRLDILRGMTQQIAGLCGLNVFSTEIALSQQHIWQVVDYVNEPCDYRLKSKAVNGVPDEVVRGVAERIAAWVKRSI